MNGRSSMQETLYLFKAWQDIFCVFHPCSTQCHATGMPWQCQMYEVILSLWNLPIVFCFHSWQPSQQDRQCCQWASTFELRLVHTTFRKRLYQSKSPRVRLQSLEKRLDQMVRHMTFTDTTLWVARQHVLYYCLCRAISQLDYKGCNPDELWQIFNSNPCQTLGEGTLPV